MTDIVIAIGAGFPQMNPFETEVRLALQLLEEWTLTSKACSSS